jgi:hypothetical protein
LKNSEHGKTEREMDWEMKRENVRVDIYRKRVRERWRERGGGHKIKCLSLWT